MGIWWSRGDLLPDTPNSLIYIDNKNPVVEISVPNLWIIWGGLFGIGS